MLKLPCFAGGCILSSKKESARQIWRALSYKKYLYENANNCKSQMLLRFRFELGCAFGVNADKFAFLTFVLKFDKTFDQSKKRIVFTSADVFARFPFRAALTR